MDIHIDYRFNLSCNISELIYACTTLQNVNVYEMLFENAQF